jgi:hypothetical protein
MQGPATFKVHEKQAMDIGIGFINDLPIAPS